jgi:hypothetical protein
LHYDIFSLLRVLLLLSRRYRGVAALQQMLQHAGHATDVLYYEQLDMPLPQLEQLKSLRVRCGRFKELYGAVWF